MARLFISAAHKSSGKTVISMGVMRAFRRRGLAVQPFKKGPDFIDPMWHTAAAGRVCRNLDYNTQSLDEIRACMAQNGGQADLALIEGNMSFHDGIDPEGSDSSAALAADLMAPVVLVIDCHGAARGIVPVVKGNAEFDPRARVAGVILNKVAGARHEDKLRTALGRYTDIPVLGALHRQTALTIDERHLGLVTSVEAKGSDASIDAAADAVEAAIDLDALMEIARSAPDLPPSSLTMPAATGEDPVTIAVARDSAFCFYYPDNLEALERAGARLIYFSPLSESLPEADGLFLGGGFPETHMERLAANGALRTQIASAIEHGLPVYAECGGLIYLSRSIQWGTKVAEMVGALPGRTVMHRRPNGRGLARLEETVDFPWPKVNGAAVNGTIPAHEFHYTSLEDLEIDKLRFAYRMKRGQGVDGAHDGLVIHNVLASYAHLRHTGRTPWAERFVAFIRDHRRGHHQ